MHHYHIKKFFLFFYVKSLQVIDGPLPELNSAAGECANGCVNQFGVHCKYELGSCFTFCMAVVCIFFVFVFVFVCLFVCFFYGWLITCISRCNKT